MATIRLSDITITRGNFPAGGAWRRVAELVPGRRRRFSIHHLTLTVPHGRTLVILGPSGCGKSTLLRVIAGLEPPDDGRVLFNGKDVRNLPVGERKIGMLFQSYALYPHFSAEQNITSWFFFRPRTPEMNRLRAEKFRRTSELLDVEIAYLLDRMPSHLSGGEKQRVALGRCITRDPELFLLDEPFSNLDAKLRGKYRLHLKTLLREFAITTVYVTHDQHEAALLGDLIAVMRMHSRDDWNIGTLEQTGTVQELYDHPGNTFVADFLNLQGDVPAISFLPGHELTPTLRGFTVGVRPEDVQVDAPAGEEAATPQAAGGLSLRAQVQEVQEDPLRQFRVLVLRLGASRLTAKVHPTVAGAPGDTVPVRFRRYLLFDAASGEAARRNEAVRQALG